MRDLPRLTRQIYHRAEEAVIPTWRRRRAEKIPRRLPEVCEPRKNY